MDAAPGRVRHLCARTLPGRPAVGRRPLCRGTTRVMNLLEALLALVILGLSATGFLDLFRGGADAAARATEWHTLVDIAESTLEASALGDALQAERALPPVPASFRRDLRVLPREGNLAEIVVTVTSPKGTVFTVHRLARGVRS